MRLYLFFLLITIFGCSSQKEKSTTIKSSSKQAIQIDTLLIDQIMLEDVNTSYVTEFYIGNDGINVIDKRFGWIFHFDFGGNLISQSLGQGAGPKEINTSYIDGFVQLPNRKMLFMGSSFDIHYHDKDYERIQTKQLSWLGSQNPNKVRKGPGFDPNEFLLYTLDYQNMVLRTDNNGYFYIPINGELAHFNGYTSHEYYQEGRILAKVAIDEMKVVDLLGTRSKKYLNYKYLGHHARFSYDIDNQNMFYVSHEIDPLIYLYNSSFELKSKFGVEGKDMDTSYTEITELDPKKIRNLFFNERPKLGWYHHIEYFDNLDILFRSYKKGIEEQLDGLQIYKNKILVGDVSVPKGLKVIGYKEPYFYAEANSEEVTDLFIYKFKVFL
ncbi:MAG: hypothetical protein ACI9XJ_001824 [Marivirga sp.]|jgi:hypothetical protein